MLLTIKHFLAQFSRSMVPLKHAKFLTLKLCRFQATRQIRHLENEINEQIASGESSAEMFGNVGLWHVPILAMTADVIQASNEQCMKCGMDDYVSKPFEDEQLYTAVARFFMSG